MERVATWHRQYGLNRCLSLVGLAKSSWYHHTSRRAGLSSRHQQIKDLLVDILAEFPEYGRRKLLPELRARLGRPLNHKPVRRVLQQADLQLLRSIKPPPPSPVRKILARHKGELNRLAGRQFGPFDLLSADFTQLVYRQGSRRAWLIGFYDPASCHPCGWAVGLSADTDLALEGWDRVRETYARWSRPLKGTVLHTDKDSVFRSYRWLHETLCRDRLEISFSERGAKDNPWIESLWSRLKAEHGQVLFDSPSLDRLGRLVDAYFDRYIHRRRHQSLGQRMPIEILNQQQTNGEMPGLPQRVLVL